MATLPSEPLTSSTLQVIARVPQVNTSAPLPRQTITAPAPPPDVFADFARLIAQALATGGTSTSRQQLLDGMARRIGATGVALGWQRAGQARWLIAVSGQKTVDLRSESGRALQAACAETWLQAKTLDWPNASGQRSTPPTYRQLGDLTNAQQVSGLPLSSNADAPTVLLIWGDLTTFNKLRAGPAWGELREPLAGLVRLLDDATPSNWSIVTTTIGALVRRRRWLAFLAGSLLTALALVPVPDRVSCSATLEPQLRRYAVSPIDGKLEKSLVRTGDQVTAGQTLAVLDPRPLQMEISVLRGELEEASKRRAAAQAKGQAALTQIAALEGEQISAKISHLQHQLEQLTVVSPIAGVIVRGDLERVEGAPLARGNSMFEIAPLSQLVAELAIPEAEVRLVEPGMQVTLWPTASPGRSIAGTIARVHPRAEIRDHQSVFIAEVIVDNQQNLLRPGMQAQSVVWSRTQPLGWTLVRRPCTQISRWLWW